MLGWIWLFGNVWFGMVLHVLFVYVRLHQYCLVKSRVIQVMLVR
jgi:hypothetical protein